MLNNEKFINILFNNSSSLELDLLCVAKPNIPSTSKKTIEKPIPGRGILIEELDEYEDIEIPIEFNYKNRHKNQDRKIRKWLNMIDDYYLKFSDDIDYIYKVKKVTKEPTANDFLRGNFTVVFLCEGLQYTEYSIESMQIANNSILFNDGDIISKPIIEIKGEGLVTLSINNIPVTVNIGQSITINSEIKLCYKSIGEWRNADMRGEWPVLKVGANNISWTGNVNSLSIITNSRFI